MARLVIAWELGRGLGHIVPMGAIATESRRRGHDVVLVRPSSVDDGGLLALPGCTTIALDLPPAPARLFPLSVNYSANLLRNGYWDRATARHRVEAWRKVLAENNPDVLIVEHAPGALLANRDRATPCVVIGNGFAVPPLGDPMSPLQPWLPIPEQRLRLADEAFLTVVNGVMADLSLPVLSTVSGVFDGCSRLLTTEQELDHYSDRIDGTFVGTLAPARQLALPALSPSIPEGFVFVYVSSFNRFLPRVLDALANLRWPVVAYVPGLPERTRQGRPAVVWLDAPIDLASLDGRCRLVVTAGGSMLGSLLLKRGLPWLVCPEDLEKAVIGLQLAKRGLAQSLNWFAPTPDDLTDRLRLVAEEPPAAQRMAFAARYRERNNEQVAGEVIDACNR